MQCLLIFSCFKLEIWLYTHHLKSGQANEYISILKLIHTHIHDIYDYLFAYHLCVCVCSCVFFWSPLV